MIFSIECESLIGDIHKSRKMLNQDAYYFDYNESVACLCIADGAGSKKYSHLGAAALTKDICRYLMQFSSDFFSSDYSEHRIKKRITEEISNCLMKTSKLANVCFSELASTLMFIITNGYEYILGHLGDGVILAQRSATVNVLSFPENGKTYSETFLTSMPDIWNYIKIEKKQCASIESLWVMTDGTMFKVFQDNFVLPENRLTMNLIKNRLNNSHKDDATFGCISWRNE